MEDGTVLGDRGDSLHWSTFSVIEMGKRYAAKMLAVSDYTPPENRLRLEFEDFSTQEGFSPFEKKSDASVSNGAYIVWPEHDGQILSSPSDSVSGRITAQFTLSEQTDVDFSVRANLPSAGDDAFYYKLDSGDWKSQNQKLTSDWGTFSVARFESLSAGPHTLQIARQEDGAMLDKFYLTASSGTIQ
jgi:hypothetical protein